MKYLKVLGVLVAILMLVSVVNAEYVPFKVKLNSLERLMMGSLLPKESSFANYKIFNDLKIELSFTEEEKAAINMKFAENGGVIADWSAVKEKEITFGATTEKIVIEALIELDKQEKLLPEHISLYEKFVVREKKEETK